MSTLKVKAPRSVGSVENPESARHVARLLSEKSGVNLATSYRWVRGKGVLPETWGKLRDAATALGYQVEVTDGGA